MNVLVLATQPGEELRHLGGSLAKWAANGSNIHIAYFTLGNGKQPQSERLEELARAKRAVKVLGINPEQLHVLDQQISQVDPLSLSDAITSLINSVNPKRLILPPAQSKLHNTRQLTQAAEMALHPVSSIATVLQMHGEQWHVDISAHLLDKQDAITALEGAAHEFPHPFSPEAVEVSAQAAGSHVNLLAAEAFNVWQVIES